MKKLLFVFLLAGTAALCAAQVKTVPADVMTWYTDVMVMYGDLAKGIDKAKTAKAAAAAFDGATAAITGKKLAVRYKALKQKYPQFFEGEGESDTTWVPPAEWMKVAQDYSTALQGYGTGMQKIMTWYTDPGVQNSMEAFSEAAGEFDSE